MLSLYGFGQPFVVSDESTEARLPCKGSFYNPSSWQQDESVFGFLELDYLKGDAVLFCSAGRIVACVALVNESKGNVCPVAIWTAFDNWAT